MTSVEAKFAECWDEEVAKRQKQSPSFTPDQFTATGRASAKYGGKRNADWWLDNGPQMVQDWIDWRKQTNWDILTIAGKPCVEIELRFVLPGMDMQVLAYIDRVFVLPTGELAVVDLKGLATDTPIATPTGWSTMAALEVGDEVFGSDGRPCKVTAKSETKFIDCYRVTFDDGRSIVCDAEHLWETTTGSRKKETSVKDIGLIKRTLKNNAVRAQCEHRIKMPLPLSLPEADLPIDPYVLGAWLGDGHHNRGVITKPDQELFEEIERRGYAIGIPQIDKRTGVQTRTVLGLQTALKAAGYLGDKHVPGAYLRSSISQRLDLLRGLMDTDGSYNKPRKTVVFTSTDKAMAFAVEELALSLGERARTFEVQRTGYGKTVTAYDVAWRPQVFNPFILPRKADQVDISKGSVRSQQRIIQSVEPMPTVATVCIAVDSPDNMYLAGEGMIPTHNTGRTPETPEQLGLYRVGLGLVHNYWPDWGYWWQPGPKGHGQPLDLTMYTPEYFAEDFEAAIRGINAGCFLATPANNCKAWCGVARFCKSVGGSLS